MMRKVMLIAFACLTVAGCSNYESTNKEAAGADASELSYTPPPPPPPPPAPPPPSAVGRSWNSALNDSGAITHRWGMKESDSSIHQGELQGNVAKDKQATITRKIIYNAEINLIVEDLDAGEKQFRQLITLYGGQIASSDLRGQSGVQRSGRWKVRIPVDKFDAFKAAAEKIGNLERSSTNSNDVTEEFYDIEARLKNKVVEEKRLIQHLEKTTAKLSDILEVEKELSRVRGEIEQMQGRLNMLSNLTSLTTIDVSIREVKNYVPPTAPSFGDDVGRTLSSSWTGLINTGRRVALNTVSIVPWLPFWIILAIILYYPVRRLWRRLRDQSIPKEPAVTST